VRCFAGTLSHYHCIRSNIAQGPNKHSLQGNIRPTSSNQHVQTQQRSVTVTEYGHISKHQGPRNTQSLTSPGSYTHRCVCIHSNWVMRLLELGVARRSHHVASSLPKQIGPIACCELPRAVWPRKQNLALARRTPSWVHLASHNRSSLPQRIRLSVPTQLRSETARKLLQTARDAIM
jgi:hypothetical protein